MSDFKISIVMAVYNAESYLDEAISSIIRQTLPFSNIQLILVNDGSTDESKAICCNYQKKYPANIIYLEKSNGGVSTARNIGLKYVKGQYVNFMDSDDIIRPQTLLRVSTFFDDNYEDIDMVSIPLEHFGALTGLHGKYELLGYNSRIVDLINEPYNFISSAAASFYKVSLVDELQLQFDESMTTSEDSKFSYNIYQIKEKIGYVYDDEVMYLYRKHQITQSLVDQNKKDPQMVTSIEIYLDDIMKNKGEIPDYIKEIIIYEVRFRFKIFNVNDFESVQQRDLIMKKISYYLSFVEDDFIINRSAYSKTRPTKYMIAALKYGKKPWMLSNNMVTMNSNEVFHIKKLGIRIYETRIINNELIITIFVNDYNVADYQVLVQGENNQVIMPYIKKKMHSEFDGYLGVFYMYATRQLTFRIPITSNTYSFYVKNDDTNDMFKLTNVKISNQQLPFVLHDAKIKIAANEYDIVHTKNKLRIYQSRMPETMSKWLSYFHIRRKYKYEAKLRLKSKRDKKNILIVGMDNLLLYQYIKENNSELSGYTYFVTNKDENKYGSAIEFGSVEHQEKYLNAKYIVSSNQTALELNPFSLDKQKYYQDLLSFRYVMVAIEFNSCYNKISSGAYNLVVNDAMIRKKYLAANMFYEEEEVKLIQTNNFFKIVELLM